MTIDSALTTATNGMLRNASAVQQAADRIVRLPTGTGTTTGTATGTTTVTATGITTDATDLASEIITLKQAEIGYSANAQVIRTADSMGATLLRILA